MRAFLILRETFAHFKIVVLPISKECLHGSVHPANGTLTAFLLNLIYSNHIHASRREIIRRLPGNPDPFR
jgi:hypothetical protein